MFLKDLVVEPILNLLFPVYCPVCDSYMERDKSRVLCPKCWDSIIRINPPYCIKCCKPYYSFNNDNHRQKEGHLCNQCRRIRIYFDHTLSGGIYDGALREAIHLFKYNGKKNLSTPLGDFLYDELKTKIAFEKFEYIIPVPLHKIRLKERGFNQTLLISRRLSKNSKIPIITNVLKKKKPTPPQADLPLKDRKRNVRGAFFLKNPHKIHGRRIILLDDVYTTGSTVNECSRVLKKAGAAEVTVFTLARAQ